MTTTCITNAELAIVYDAETDTHLYRRDCDIVFDETSLLHIGPGYTGAVDATVDGRGMMVMPGLVNVHSHPSSEPGNKGLTDEVGSPKLYNSSLYEYLWLFRADADGIPHLNHMSWSELLMSGVTTLVDLSFPSAGWVDRAAASGMRLVLAPMYRNGRWFTRNGYVVEYELDDAAGRKSHGGSADDHRRGRRTSQRPAQRYGSARRRSIPAPRTCCASRLRPPH